MSWFSKRRDPRTGDMLSLGERAAWLAQGVIRRWAFLLFLVAGSVFWWTHGSLLHDPSLLHWNVVASLLALVIESIVGMGMFNQTRRDAVILRELRVMTRDLHNQIGTSRTVLELLKQQAIQQRVVVEQILEELEAEERS